MLAHRVDRCPLKRYEVVVRGVEQVEAAEVDTTGGVATIP